ncbi:hypothetical protein EDB81DRAFT_858101 [Dactylonectria macrodidyma]|uniref:Uncharacterized protein n=1 Tax=Dactylonectria macrodidyma TaxID=307937 RepID=A0A9P9J2P2_9HYPO|nr:hypothetical protein EDB81DRAFT_858101 [Dactylonectria macrodidyma]
MTFLFGPPRPPTPGVYEYTEVIAFQFFDPSAPASLSDETTDLGKTCASTLRTYLELEQTGIVWWTMVHGAPNESKLFIDWKTTEGRQAYEASLEAEHLCNAWKPVTSSPVHTALYVFPRQVGTRELALGSPVENTARWDKVMAQFSSSVTRSPGGVVASGCCLAWGLNRGSYIAAFRYISIDAMNWFLEENKATTVFDDL